MSDEKTEPQDLSWKQLWRSFVFRVKKSEEQNRWVGLAIACGVGLPVLLYALNSFISSSWAVLAGNNRTIWFGILDLLVKIGGGALVIYGLFLTNKRIKVTEDGQVTERFTRAIDQIGNAAGEKPNIEVRLGGVYALGRIARDSEKDYWTVMEVLSAYVRENASIKHNKDGQESELPAKPRVDIQAALTVVCRKKKRRGERIYLRDTDLKGLYFHKAYLEGARMERAHLEETHFEGAHLRGAILQGVFLQKAHLHRADLMEANLQGAKLQKAKLQKAKLQKAKLQRANLQGANLGEAQLDGALLHGADFRGANLCKASLSWTDIAIPSEVREEGYGEAGLSIYEQTSVIIIDISTVLPDSLQQYWDEMLEASEANLKDGISDGWITPEQEESPPEPQ